ncbi:MAG: fumarylacetoacetate hydrolase family protein [Bacteroidota bacterium]
MKKYTLILGIFILLITLLGGGFFLYLNRGLAHDIKAAEFSCLDLQEGTFTTFDTLPNHIYGIGLSYAGHINETASSFDPDTDPPAFRKAVSSITGNQSSVSIPTKETLLHAVDQIEPGLGAELQARALTLPALLDYEVELAFVLLEDVDPLVLATEGYAPKIGFFIANDLSARSLAILGEGQKDRYEYWGVSKSFSGFTPVSSQIWIPNTFQPSAIPCIMLETQVNGEVRQRQSTSDMIYTPLQMLRVVQRRYPNTTLKKGDWVLMGTPGGVVLSTSRWLVRLANMLGMDRFKKLANKTKNTEVAKFLKPGDTVITTGEGLGSVEIEIVAE